MGTLPATEGAQTLAQPRATDRPKKTFAALRHQNFRLYFSGQMISAAGTWMQIVAQGWLVYELSRSELILGLIGFASAIPALLVSPWGGVVVDRMSKRTLLILTQSTAMVLAFILSFLTFSGLVQVWQIVLLAVGIGLVNAFDGPARQAFVVEMVGREDLTNAIAINSMVFNSARVIGPALGGFLLVTVGAAWCFLINGISFLAVIACLLSMRLPRPERKRESISPWSQLAGGLKYVSSQPELGGLILLALIFSIFGISYSAVLPAFIDRVLHQGASSYAWINAAIGAGAVMGAFLVARFGDRGKRGRWLLIANTIFPFILAVFAWNRWFPLAVLLALGLGVGFMLQFTLINTLLQTSVSDSLRGRVLSLYTLTFFGVGPFGSLLMGWLSERWGLSLTVSLSALATLLFSQIVFRRFRVITRLN